MVVWSSFTAVTGLARGFWHLLFARVCVGIGEAGCSPPAYSLISDYFEPKKRATALSIFQHLKGRLAPFKRIRRLEFAELPKTISGKIRRVELRRDEEKRAAEQKRGPGEFREEDFPELTA